MFNLIFNGLMYAPGMTNLSRRDRYDELWQQAYAAAYPRPANSSPVRPQFDV